MATENIPVIPSQGAESTPPVTEPPPAPELTLEEREKLSLEQEGKQRHPLTGAEQAPPAEEAPPDPRAARRAELLAQLAALDYQATPAAEMSDKELHIAFHDALVLALGSHPSLDGLWQEIKKRALAS